MWKNLSGHRTEDICIQCEFIPREVTAEEEFSNQADKILWIS
jgi:hypothetical protein